jgi:hypothetical protein
MENQKSNTPRSLSEISHLFLSSVRDRQTCGSQRPVRTPPQTAPIPSVDLTKEELSGAFENLDQAAVDAESVAVPPVRLLIASHFGARQLEYTKRYARNLAVAGNRIGLIVADISEFRLFTFGPA